MRQPTRPTSRRTAWQVFGWPLLIGIFAVIGLVLGLTGDGARDWLAVALLAAGPAVFARAWSQRG